MRHNERLVVVATAGLLIATVGAFLPWTRVGGRNRSGFATADTFLGLASGALPDVVAWVGRWWYIPAFMVVIAWATVFLGGRWYVRTLGTLLAIAALVMWWAFVWIGRDTGLIQMKLLGPVVASIGTVVVAACCTRSRASLLAAN